MASWALLGVPAAMGPVTMMSAAAASKGEKKAGLFDWLSGALDKSVLTEMDPILEKEAAAPRPSAPPPKKPAPPNKQGRRGFFGVTKK